MGTRSQPASPAPRAVRAELARVLASTDFVMSERLTQFLRYVIEETLQGRADRIKERTVARNALERGADFDPRIDPVVRILAGKLRRALERYYAQEGAKNPLRIEMPKGGYRPVFHVPVQQPAEHNGLTQKTDGHTVSDLAELPESKRLRGLLQGRATYSIAVLMVAFLLLSGWFFRPKFEESPQGEQGLSGNSGRDEMPPLIEQTGALPYRMREGGLEVLLVRTLRDSHWTIPKATQNPDTDAPLTASQEAFQEAGVQGTARPAAIGEYFYERNGKLYHVTVYPVLAQEELSSWPENKRQRQWCSIQAASDLIAADELSTLVRRFDPTTP